MSLQESQANNNKFPRKYVYLSFSIELSFSGLGLVHLAEQGEGDDADAHHDHGESSGVARFFNKKETRFRDEFNRGH